MLNKLFLNKRLVFIYKYIINIVLIVVLIHLYSCNNESYIPFHDNKVISIDFEFEKETDTVSYYINNNPVTLIVRGNIVSNEAHEGKKSLFIKGENKFTLPVEVPNSSDINYIKVSIWRKDISGNSTLVVQGDNKYYVAVSDAVEKTADGWEKLEIEAFPPSIENVISVYFWTNRSDSVYLDDYKVEFLQHKEYPLYKNNDKILLYFSDKKISELNEKIDRAFDEGVLINDGEWVKGIMSDEKNVMPIKTRLKGDWLDHFEGQKYSLRIKMRDDYVFKRMKVFSIQNPKVRNYLREFVSHKLFIQEGLLTTRYGFIPVYKNSRSTGIYAWEEHFAKQLIEYNLRREGPILKFDEDPFWRMNQYFKTNKKWLSWPYFEESRVLAFGMNKTLKNPVLRKQFDIGQRLLYQYKNFNANIDEVFDVDALAKYWALIDIVDGRHGLAWHNNRFYYNPVLCKLEPISYDNYTEINIDDRIPVVTPLLVKDSVVIEAEHFLSNKLFMSEELVSKYIDYVEKYTDKSFIDQFFENYKDEINLNEDLIQQEFSDYKFDKSYIYKNAEIIKSNIPLLKDKLKSGFFKRDFKYSFIKRTRDTTYFKDAIPDYINAFYFKKGESFYNLKIENYTGFDILPIGLANDKGRLIYLFENDFVVNNYFTNSHDTTMVLPEIDDVSQFVFSVKNHDDILYSELSLWEKSMGLSPYQKLKKEFNLDSCNLFRRSNDTLYVSGQNKIEEKILVPKGLVVVFEAGTSIDFVKKACFISYSPVIFNGEKSKAIRISSSDSTANGFTVLQAQSKSYLNYVEFVNLNTLNYEGWTLTGSVSFYESDVDINHCLFESNHSEDALNIVRSNFNVANSHFNQIFSDAFDSDFCKGNLTNSTFKNVINDAIDFSTSQIYIDKCEMSDIGDKGVSGGEGSKLWVSNTNMTRCNIGAASKDLTEVELLNVTISDCKYGLVALRKKPEYGAAKLIGKKLSINNCETTYLIEENSVLIYNGRKIQGNRKNVAKLFY